MSILPANDPELLRAVPSVKVMLAAREELAVFKLDDIPVDTNAADDEFVATVFPSEVMLEFKELEAP